MTEHLTMSALAVERAAYDSAIQSRDAEIAQLKERLECAEGDYRTMVRQRDELVVRYYNVEGERDRARVEAAQAAHEVAVLREIANRTTAALREVDDYAALNVVEDLIAAWREAFPT